MIIGATIKSNFEENRISTLENNLDVERLKAEKEKHLNNTLKLQQENQRLLEENETLKTELEQVKKELEENKEEENETLKTELDTNISAKKSKKGGE